MTAAIQDNSEKRRDEIGNGYRYAMHRKRRHQPTEAELDEKIALPGAPMDPEEALRKLLSVKREPPADERDKK